METIKIKPAKATIKVRDPDTLEFLNDKGEEKPRNSYWLARLRDGDVVMVESKPKGEK
ncbi:DUF2635 domain-containing protein [Frederiksenia canicola]